MRKNALIAFALLVVVAIPAHADTAATRFGSLATNDENVLLFKGKPVSPEVQGNNSLSILNVSIIGEEDVALVRDNGGTGCPAMFYGVTVTATGARATKPFGTCTDLFKLSYDMDSLVVEMSGFQGPSESQASQKKASLERHVFRVTSGSVTEVPTSRRR